MSSAADTALQEDTLIDVSHAVEDGMITYKGLPAPLVCDFLSFDASRDHYAEGTEFNIGKIEMVANTGTYVDSPYHRFRNGSDLSELELASLAHLEGLVIRATKRTARGIGIEWFENKPVQGKAVLIHTGWDQHWRTDQYFEGHPFLTAEAAEYLAQQGAQLVGVDSLNIDDTGDLARPAHTALLGAGIPVAEHLCRLGLLPDEGFRFHAAPVKVEGMGTFPVRAYGIVRKKATSALHTPAPLCFGVAPCELQPPIILVHQKGIALDPADSPLKNYQALQSSYAGLKILADSVRELERQCITENSFPEGAVVYLPSAVPPLVPCAFNWFAITLANYLRLVALVELMTFQKWTSSALTDAANRKTINDHCREFVRCAAPEVHKWRDKVAAHFAATSPFQDDNLGTLEQSIMYPVTYNYPHYYVGMVRWSTQGETSDLPMWALTKTYEDLATRFWPELKLKPVKDEV